jgi:hypothetical protein
MGLFSFFAKMDSHHIVAANPEKASSGQVRPGVVQPFLTALLL